MLIIWPLCVEADTSPPGFAVERFYPSPAGAGWFVLDELKMQGSLSGAIALSLGYARRPLPPAVNEQAFSNFSASVTYNRFRFYLDLTSPLLVSGEGGTLGPSQNPDIVSDSRIGLDARIFGRAESPLRLGIGTQLIVPSGDQAAYHTDGTYRGMFRALLAGDIARLSYAAQLGFHLRPAGPERSEFLFGLGVGRRFDLCTQWALIAGPELYGETALRSMIGHDTTGLEGLIIGRFEGTKSGPQLRLKAGVGAGLDARFGAPQWRLLIAVELFSRGPVTNLR